MPNPNTIRYSTATQSGALRKGNFYLGVTDRDYGPTNITNYFNGVTFSTGYMSYFWDGSEIRYNDANTDSALISFLSSRATTQFSSLTASLVWSMTQSNLVVLNKNYENIVTDGLVLNLDASFVSSYPRSGNTWYDTGGVNNGTLNNGPIFNTENGGSILLDGINDFINVTSTPIFSVGSMTYEIVFRPISNRSNGPLGSSDLLNAIPYFYLDYGSGDIRTYHYGTNPQYFTVQTVATGSIYHFVCTRNGLTESNYINGVTASGRTLSNNNGNNDGFGHIGYLIINIMLTVINLGIHINANIYLIRIYNRALTSQEVIQNLNATVNRYSWILKNGIWDDQAFWTDSEIWYD